VKCEWCGAVGIDPSEPHFGNTQYTIGDVVTIDYAPELGEAVTASGKARVVGWDFDTHRVEFEVVTQV